MNIVLTGLRGSGKTSLGKLLAEKLRMKFVDIDKEVEKEQQLKISEIVEQKGWDFFRRAEAKTTEKISKGNNLVIATGGGTITFPKNAKNLEKNGKVIYLHVFANTGFERIKDDPNRPPLTNETNLLKEMEKLYNERHEVYQKTADIIFDRTDSLEKDSSRIIAIIKK